MSRLCLGVLLLVYSSAALGQQSVTVTSSRSISLQPDEALFVVSVTSGVDIGLNDVVAALSGSGIGVSTFVSVSSYNSQQTPTLQWTFGFPSPISKIKDVFASLSAAQQALAQKKSGVSISFYLQALQVSPQLQASQTCPVPELVADARAQAQKLANSSGVTVGPILALAEGGGVPAPVQVPILASRSGDFSLSQFLIGVPVQLTVLPVSTPQLNCTVTVKFSVLSSQ